jgi:hypothetical protein
VIFAIAAVVLAMSSLNIFNKEKFTDMQNTQNVVPRYTGAPSLSAAQNVENYQDSIVMNVGSSPDNATKLGAMYYNNIQNYLSPSIDNLELAQNISSRPIMAGVNLPGAANSYKNNLGDGFVSNLGILGGNVYPSVSYQNDRASQLSQCAQNLPMFAASSLLPKPSVNANNNALSQSAARALSMFTSLSPIEEIGAPTNNKSPYGRITDIRKIPVFDYNNSMNVPFGGSSQSSQSPIFGQINAATGMAGGNGL